MVNKTNQSVLLSKYQGMYQEKPRSRVFAPLAETYRKLGMLREAMKVLRDGLRYNPSYTLGYVVLAHCFHDVDDFENCYQTLRPFIQQNLENISMQRLYANACFQLGHLEEALNTYKYILLLNPRDQEVSAKIKLLEDDLLIHQGQESDIATKNLSSSFEEDEWVQVDFNQNQNEHVEHVEHVENVEDLTSWKLEQYKKDVGNQDSTVSQRNLDDAFFHQDFDTYADDVILPENQQQVNDLGDPIISHTLVDLYVQQGHKEKAVDILENILKLHPDDRATLSKLRTLSEGGQKIEHFDLLEKAFGLFLEKCQMKSLKYMS